MQSKLVSAEFDLDDFMQMSVDLLRGIFNAGGVVVELVDGDEMVYVAIDAENARYHGLRLSRQTSLSGQAAREGRLLYCADAHDDPRVDRAACDSIGIRSMVCAPLFQDGLTVGVLKAFDAKPNAFDNDDIEAVTLVAETLGAALAKQLQHSEREGLLVELAMARDEAEAEARRARMAEAMGGLGHWRYDYATGDVNWSDEMYDLHALPRGAPLDRESVLALVHPEDRELVAELLRDAQPFEDGRPFTSFRLRRADGVDRRMEALTAVELDEQGERAAIMGVLRDITERHERERELADPERVRQLVLNLAGNAVKYTDAGAVTVTVGPSIDGKSLVFAVSDTGPGISPDGVERLFLRFSQVNGEGQDGSGGTGLGLAICKGLIDAMGGAIGVESTPGDGSRFWFSLPLLAVDLDPAHQPGDQPANIQGRKVLVVDDSEANRILLRTILQAFGAEVVEAQDGAQAVDQAGQRGFDLILMDLRMPVMDGISAARRIRQMADARKTPILAFSADREPVLDQALFDGAVPKPIDPETLLAAMARAIA